MAVELPDLPRAVLAEELRRLSPEALADPTVDRLWVHYRELRRWGRRLSLIGPGTAEEVLERHYGESLAALPWCPEGPLRHVDLGSGGGFPGLVLAASRPLWSTTLVEPRDRKWAFLSAVVRRAGLSSVCLDARVDARLPPGFPDRVDVVTVRALRLAGPTWEAVTARLAPGARVLWWQGDDDGDWPPSLRRVADQPLAGSEVRRIVWAESVTTKKDSPS